MILTVDAGSRSQVGAMVVEAWKYGIEVEKLHGNQLELTCTYDDKLNRYMSKFPNVKILHTELIKEVGI